MKLKHAIAASTLLWAGLMASQPTMSQNLQNSKQDLVENLDKTNSSLNTTILDILNNNKNKIIYFTSKESKVYSDAEWTDFICNLNAWTFIRANQINSEISNSKFICCNFRWNTVWVPKSDLIESDNNISFDKLRPRTEKSIVVDKANRRMFIYDNYGKKLIKEIQMALSPWWSWDKIIEWDWNTPEGKYYICYKNPASSFWKHPKTGNRLWSLQISYPNLQDATEGLVSWDINKSEYQSIKSAVSKKWIPNQWTNLWNYIMIHWGGNEYDWTAWCIGLSNEDMLWLYNYISTWTDMFIW